MLLRSGIRGGGVGVGQKDRLQKVVKHHTLVLLGSHQRTDVGGTGRGAVETAGRRQRRITCFDGTHHAIAAGAARSADRVVTETKPFRRNIVVRRESDSWRERRTAEKGECQHKYDLPEGT